MFIFRLSRDVTVAVDFIYVNPGCQAGLAELEKDASSYAEGDSCS